MPSLPILDVKTTVFSRGIESFILCLMISKQVKTTYTNGYHDIIINDERAISNTNIDLHELSIPNNIYIIIYLLKKVIMKGIYHHYIYIIQYIVFIVEDLVILYQNKLLNY